jgi:hypothetical protein
MSLTAVVRLEGVGDVYVAAYTLPVTCGELAKVPVESAVSEKPVMYVAAAGLQPMSPVMTDSGTVSMPVLARMA